MRLLFLIILCFVLNGCTHYPAATSSLSGTQNAYLLRENDVLQLRVYDEREFSGKFKIDSMGNIALPLAGKINIRNRTEEQASFLIENALKQKGFLRNPKVSVEIAEARPYFILGEVTRAGQFPFQTGLTVYQAVATSGGFTYRADRDDITIRRQSAAGTGKEIRLSATEDTPILPGDVIEIGERYF